MNFKFAFAAALILGAYGVFQLTYKPIKLLTVVLVGEAKGVTKINFGCNGGEELLYSSSVGTVVVLGDSEINIKRSLNKEPPVHVMRIDSTRISPHDPDNLDYLVAIEDQVRLLEFIEEDIAGCGYGSLVIEWN